MKNVLTIAALAIAASISSAEARDQIRIVGSSTVYPFATVVAETFGRETDYSTPVIESTGSGGGLKLFCEGVGLDTPDVTNASRAIKSSEVELCQSNGVINITEVMVGYDGIVIAKDKTGAGKDLTLEQLFLALAAEVPGPNGTLVENPNVLWSDVDSGLPAVVIEVLGPPPTSGTRDAFVELVMEEAAETVLADLNLSEEEFDRASKTMREDGAFIEAGENDNVIVQRLQANPDSVGIFGYSFLDQNLDVLTGLEIDGVAPTFGNIADGSYPISRSLFFYVKDAHRGVVPGLVEYVELFVSENMSGEGSELSDRGLIPVTENRDGMVRSVK